MMTAAVPDLASRIADFEKRQKAKAPLPRWSGSGHIISPGATTFVLCSLAAALCGTVVYAGHRVQTEDAERRQIAESIKIAPFDKPALTALVTKLWNDAPDTARERCENWGHAEPSREFAACLIWGKKHDSAAATSRRKG